VIYVDKRLSQIHIIPASPFQKPEIRLFDCSGRVLPTQRLSGSESELIIRYQESYAGICILNISDGKTMINQKIIL